MKYIMMGLIKIYQYLFSFDYGIPGKIFPGVRVCRLYPSCSEYCYESVKRHGSIQGSFLGAKRIVKCGPWTEFGTYDPVP